ncbi:hypothetical protein DDI_0303 [Dickeya dianthicola RNS04.9]|nr:hypothetical protein DDI_0303 [Dickeya dianthicola RNS04.9]
MATACSCWLPDGKCDSALPDLNTYFMGEIKSNKVCFVFVILI